MERDATLDVEVDTPLDLDMDLPLELVARPFRELSRDELYELLVLRARVFVVEQDCPYLDPDGLDPEAIHLVGRLRGPGEGELARTSEPGSAASGPTTPVPAGSGPQAGPGRLVACARWYPDEGQVRLGRIVTAPEVRGRGLGRRLVRDALDRIAAEHPGRPVLIHGQSRLRAFYEGFGFRATGEPFDEDGIEHVEMVVG